MRRNLLHDRAALKGVQLGVAALLILGACTPSVDGSANTPTNSETDATSSPTTTLPSTTSTTNAAAYLEWVLSLETWPPITGYGDFSDLDVLDVNHFLVNDLIVQCANDRGMPVKSDGTGLAVNVREVPAQDQRQATEIVAGCRNGLNIPALDGPFHGYTLEQAQRLYDHQLLMRECLAEAGYPQENPPSFDEWLVEYWDPYTNAGIHAGDVPLLLRQCPQSPGDVPTR